MWQGQLESVGRQQRILPDRGQFTWRDAKEKELSFVAFQMWVSADRDPSKLPSRADIERIDPHWRAAIMQWDTIYEWLGDTEGWKDTVQKAREAEWKRKHPQH